MMKRIYSWAYGWSFTMKLHDEARCLWEQPAQNIAKRYSCYESGGDNPGLPATLQAGL